MVIQDASPYSEYAIVHVLVGIFIIAVILMAVLKLDRVVTASGRIITTQGSLFVQPLDRALIRDIDVSMGDVVMKGQVLAHLDPTFAAADLTRLTEKMESGEALIARLTAEREGRPYAPANPNPAQALQASLWRQRQPEYEQGVKDFDARINNARATLDGARHDVIAYSQRLEHAAAIEKMRTTLEANGNGSRLNTILATDSKTDIARLQAESQSLASQTEHTIDSLIAQRGVFVQKWQDDLASALVDAQNDLDQTRSDFAKAQKIHELISLVAPEDAIVLKIAQASVGSVVDSTAQHDPLFTLVPLNGAVEAEVEVDSKDIGFIQPGDHVEMKLEAYPFMRHGTIKGTIKTISEGSFTVGIMDEQRTPYFKARIKVDSTELKNVPSNFRLVPGMTLTGDVMVGHRTMLSYLVEGGLRTGSEAMREP